MNIVEALREFKLGIEDKLKQKTAWGRNEVVEVLNKEYQIILEKLIDMR